MCGRVTGDPSAVARIVRGAWEGDRALMAEYQVLKILKAEDANVHVRNPTGIGRTSDFIVDGIA